MKLKHLLKEEKTQIQITKLLYAVVVCTALLLLVEIIFQIPAISEVFSTEALSDNMGNNKVVWLVLWLLMFAQVTIIPVPSMPIYVFCNRTPLVAKGSDITDLFSLDTLFFICFVVSACLAGSIVAYLLGKFGGKRAVKWIAGDEDDYEKWSKALNCTAGKYIYTITVFLPIFPDDILCIVAGALSIDFKFFLLANIFGKLVGAFCLLLFLRVPYITNFFQGANSEGGVPWALIVYAILFLASLILVIICRAKEKKK